MFNKNCKKISGDASFRNFYRTKNSIIVYSKKEKKKNLLIYDSVNKILNDNNILAPTLKKESYNKNLIEISDLGDVSLLKLLKRKKKKKKIFKDVINLLKKLQKIKKFKTKNFKGNSFKIPKYTNQIIFDEADLFSRWFMPFFAKKINNDKIKKEFRNVIKKLIYKIKLPNNTFVHRDFHVSNIMFYKKKMYLIDNQDAVLGNMAYDLASLVDDVRYRTSNNLKDEIYSFYSKNITKKKLKDFENDFHILSVLRNLKILGIFTRLAKRDNKKKYLKMIPYTWQLIKIRIKNKDIFNDLRLFLKKKEFKKYIKI